jgi:Mg2+ and Co2+ transporter CorA
VHNIQPAYIFDAGNNLLEELARFLLLDSLHLHDIVE